MHLFLEVSPTLPADGSTPHLVLLLGAFSDDIRQRQGSFS